MAESIIKAFVFVIDRFEQPVLYSKSIPEIIIQVIAGDLDVPSIQVPAVEQLNPFLGIGIAVHRVAVRAGRRRDRPIQDEDRRQREDSSYSQERAKDRWKTPH